MKAKVIFILIISVFAAKNLHAEYIKIGKTFSKKEVSISAKQDFVIRDSKSGRRFAFPAGKKMKLIIRGPGFLFGGRSFGHYIKFVHMSGGLNVNGTVHYGMVDIKKTSKNRIMLIEKIDIEKYLPAVLRAEAGSGWPLETLKAQAVISRTYALSTIGRHTKEGYDLCAKVHCQVYKPAKKINPLIKKAVRATRGEVIVVAYKGELAQTYFHACCGGSTADVRDVWGGSKSYLRNVSCGYCKKSPHYRWKRFIPESRVRSALKKLGLNKSNKKIKSISISGKDSSGRAKKLVFNVKGKRIPVKAGSFRMAAGPELVRSTRISSIKRKKNGFEFRGRGWGHGVGLCQWGAKGMADRGYNYKKIIKRYYPGTRIIKRGNR